jgi:hypothetical protein
MSWQKLKKYLLHLSAISAVLMLFFLYENGYLNQPDRKSTDTQKLLTILKNCQESSQNATLCYQQKAPEILDTFELESIFEFVEKNESDPVVFAGCHSTLHFLGSEMYRREKNVSKLLGNGTPVCFAGYYHGILEGYFQDKNLDSEKSAKDLENNLANLCTRNILKEPKKYNECLHGLGHALMFATSSELPKALDLCDKLESAQDQNWCYSGAFMENSTSSTNPDHPSNYLRADDLLYPCSILSEKYLNMCYTLQGFYFAEKVNYDWPKTADLCREVPQPYTSRCFDSIGQTLVGYTQDVNTIKSVCNTYPEDEFSLACIAGAAGTLIERYNDGLQRAVSLCNVLSGNQEENCYNRVVQSVNYSAVDKQNLQKICNLFENADRRSGCNRLL